MEPTFKLVTEVHDRSRRIETKLSHLCEKLNIDLRAKPIKVNVMNNRYQVVIPGSDVTISAIRKALIDNGINPVGCGSINIICENESSDTLFELGDIRFS
jgi:hypothetical protein